MKLTDQRFISFQHQDDATLPPNRIESRRQSSGHYIKRIADRAYWLGPLLVIESETLDSITMVIQKKRNYKAINANGLVDSAWIESFDGLEWQKSRKTIYHYTDSKQLGERTEWVWSGSNHEWAPAYRTTFTFFDSVRINTRVEEINIDSTWKVQNLHRFEYLTGDMKPSSAVWFGDRSGMFVP
ncbi:MAG: hypothetical protein JNJ57_09120, partial [Saprospiraceae bacterium]|nr:hypothetical protein [Saprospiraceae bacterium]